MSNFTENVIKNNNKLYRKDPFVIALCHAAGSEMEKAIAKLDGVQSVRINFLTQKMTLEADEDRFEALVQEAGKQIRKIEPDCLILR